MSSVLKHSVFYSSSKICCFWWLCTNNTLPTKYSMEWLIHSMRRLLNYKGQWILYTRNREPGSCVCNFFNDGFQTGVTFFETQSTDFLKLYTQNCHTVQKNKKALKKFVLEYKFLHLFLVQILGFSKKVKTIYCNKKIIKKRERQDFVCVLFLLSCYQVPRSRPTAQNSP